MELTVKVGGQAGQGANVTGRTIGKLFTRCGYNVIGYPEYPSLIRGGHNAYQIRISDGDVKSPTYTSDILLALNKDAVFYHKNYMRSGGIIVCDEKTDVEKIGVPNGIKVVKVPTAKILSESGGNQKMMNTLFIGCLLALIEHPLDHLKDIIKEEFSRKGEEVVKANMNVAKGGYEFVKEKGERYSTTVQKKEGERKVLIGGNEAIAIGSVSAGMKFYSGYPMTPSSSILHYLASIEREAGIVVKHTEDEIAAINYAVGAAYAGVRAMTGSSGGGFALMVETLGMAALAETPLVVVLAQRVGPSTGMPTWTEQADLRFALHASQGEFPRFVIAPGTIEEAFYLAAESHNLAEEYQVPVILITDKFLSETHFSTSGLDQSRIEIKRGKIEHNPVEEGERFKRYRYTEDGISPRTFPGQKGGIHVASSYTHDETGFTTESFIERKKMVEKRLRKLNEMKKEMKMPKEYGSKDADISILCWGSQVLPCIDALPILEKNGIKARVVHFTHLFPLDEKRLSPYLSSLGKTIMIENNATGQFAGMLKEYLGFSPDAEARRYDGRQFFPENVVECVLEIVESGFEKKLVSVMEKEDLEYYNPSRYGL